MKTTPLRPTRLSALVGFFVTVAISLGSFGAGTAQASGGSTKICSSLARGVKTGTWKIDAAGHAVSDPFRKTLKDTGLSGLDGKTYWYGVRARSTTGAMLQVKCSVFANGKWVEIGTAGIEGTIVAGNPARVDFKQPLTQAQCNQMVAEQAINSWTQKDGQATSAPVNAGVLPSARNLLKGIWDTGMSIVRGDVPFVSVVVSEIDKRTSNLPATCLVWDAKTSTYIPIGKGTVTAIPAGGGRLTFR